MTTAAPTRPPRRRVGDMTPRYHNPGGHSSTQTRQIMLEEAAWLRSFGTTWDRVAEQLGLQPGSLAKAIKTARGDGLIGDEFPA
jgi:hypothetical protein